MKKILIITGALLLLLASFLFIPKVTTNYDMSVYLPSDSSTKQGLQIIKDEFSEQSSIQILIMNITPDALIPLKNDIKTVSHVSNVIWLDDYVDLTTTPIAYIRCADYDCF